MEIPLHPLFAHFAVALIISSAIADVLYLTTRSLKGEENAPETLRNAAMWMLVFGACGAVATFLTHPGLDIPKTLEGRDLIIETVRDHAKLGRFVAYSAGAVGIIRLGLWWKDKLTGKLYF